MLPVYITAAALIAAITWYWLRADPDEVERNTKRFYQQLYRRDAMRIRTSRH